MVDIPLFTVFLYIPGGCLGFLPSTVPLKQLPIIFSKISRMFVNGFALPSLKLTANSPPENSNAWKMVHFPLGQTSRLCSEANMLVSEGVAGT